MNQNTGAGAKIDPSQVKPGMRLFVRTKSLGGCVVEVLEDMGVKGWRVRIIHGELWGPATKTHWKVGETLSLPVYSVDRWYEPAEG